MKVCRVVFRAVIFFYVEKFEDRGNALFQKVHLTVNNMSISTSSSTSSPL